MRLHLLAVLGLILSACDGGSDAPECTQSGPVSACAADVAVSQDHRCVIRTDGALLCWGSNYSGEVGDGTMTMHDTPVQVPGLAGVVAVAVAGSSISGSASYTCAVDGGGALYCWGGGPLGTGASSSLTPVKVPLEDVVAVSAGGAHACAISGAGALSCWGSNSFGQIGVDAADTTMPTPVTGVGPVQSVAACRASTCAVQTDKRLLCWGFGPLGVTATGSSPTPVEVMTDVEQVACVPAGNIGENACARRSDGGVVCWGRGDYGVLGNGTLTASDTPTPVSSVAGAVDLSVGGQHACAITDDGVLWCWGGVYQSTEAPVPQALACPAEPARVASGPNEGCVIDGAGGLWCFDAAIGRSSPLPLELPCP